MKLVPRYRVLIFEFSNSTVIIHSKQQRIQSALGWHGAKVSKFKHTVVTHSKQNNFSGGSANQLREV